MQFSERQLHWRELLSLTSYPQERLVMLVDFARQCPALTASEKVAAYAVPGCLSAVWVVGEMREGRCFFRADGESALVRALACFVCDVHAGLSPTEVLEQTPPLWEEFRISQSLSPTRQNSLINLRQRLCYMAKNWLTPLTNLSND
jgi:cysteine desulfuration protein SufE